MFIVDCTRVSLVSSCSCTPSPRHPVLITLPLQGPESFKGVTVDIIQGEKQQLDPAEKTTHRDVLLGNYSHLISVGEESLLPQLLRCMVFSSGLLTSTWMGQM